jgi:hypothetical protein
MGRRARFLILVLAFGALLAPGLFMNAHAAFGCQTQPGNTCQLEADSHIPSSEGVVQVSITGGAYNGVCPASCSPLNNTWTLTNATTYQITVLNPSIIGKASGDRYAFSDWEYHGQHFAGSPSNPSMFITVYGNYTTAQCYQNTGGYWINCPFTAVFTVSPPVGCKTNCYMDLTTNVPTNDGTISVKVDGGTPINLTPNFPYLELTFGNGTGPHTIQIPNQFLNFTGASSGARYVFKEWICSCGNSSATTFNTPIMYNNYTDPRSAPLNPQGAVTALFDKQFPLTLTFTDPQGDSLSPPASLQLASGNTLVNLTSFSGKIYESALVWQIQNVVWEGVPQIQVQGQTVDLTNGAASVAVKLQAFPASLKAVDGSNNPVQGVTVTVYFQNSTSKTLTTNSQGLVQLGDVPLNYTAVVTYNGNTICNCVVDTANPQNNPYVVQVSVAGGGSGTAPLVSAVVILTIFGIAAFLVLLAIKVRKAPPPPRIE